MDLQVLSFYPSGDLQDSLHYCKEWGGPRALGAEWGRWNLMIMMRHLCHSLVSSPTEERRQCKTRENQAWTFILCFVCRSLPRGSLFILLLNCLNVHRFPLASSRSTNCVIITLYAAFTQYRNYHNFEKTTRDFLLGAVHVTTFSFELLLSSCYQLYLWNSSFITPVIEQTAYD